jgi:hypothetical protein
MDKGYDNNRVLDETRERGCVPIVCLRKGRPIPLTAIPYGTDEWKRLYRGRARNGRGQIFDRVLGSDASRDAGLDPVGHLVLRHPDGDKLHGGIGDRSGREADVLRHWRIEDGDVGAELSKAGQCFGH